MRRWKRHYEEQGYDGLYDRRLKRPSPRRVPLQTVERVLELYWERYFDFNVMHFVEKLHSEHEIALSYSWVHGHHDGGRERGGRTRGHLLFIRH